MTNRSGPLAGVKVLEMASYITGPLAGQVLADLGAQVIKVEPPEGDPFRRGGGGPGAARAYSPAYIGTNRSKRSISLDMKKPGARDIFERLARDTDVLLQNYRHGVAKRLKVDYDTVSALNPRVIYCSISGFGEDGPYIDRPSYNEIGQALGGLWDLMLTPDMKPPGPAFSDPLTGMFAAQTILAALYARERTGRGQHVFTNMLEATIGFFLEPYSQFFATGETVSNRAARSQAYGFRCSDGLPIAIHLSSPPKFWEALARALGREELIRDPRFIEKPARDANYDVLWRELAPIFATRSRTAWLEVLLAVDVPCAPINTVREALDDPQVRHNRVHKTVQHPVEGKVDLIGYPGHFEDTPLDEPGAPPLIGEQREQILAELGYSRDEIGRFVAERVV